MIKLEETTIKTVITLPYVEGGKRCRDAFMDADELSMYRGIQATHRRTRPEIIRSATAAAAATATAKPK